MQVRTTLSAAFLVVGSLATSARPKPVPAPARAADQVHISVTCQGENVNIRVAPWTAEVSRNGALAWVLDESSNVSDFTITPKGGWPFQDGPPYRGGRHNPSAGHRVDPNVGRGARFSYNIDVTCQNGGPVHRLTIDPDIIIVD